MDEPKRPDFNDNTSRGGQVMDIQSPKPAGTAPLMAEGGSVASSDTTTVPISPVDANSESVSNEAVTTPAIPNEPTEQPVQEAPAVTEPQPNSTAIDVTGGGTAEVKDETPSAQASVSADEKTPVDAGPMAIPATPHKKSGAPVVAILVAVVVALGIAGLVIYTFVKNKQPVKQTSSNTTQAVAKPVASPADVDATSKDLETSLNKVDDSKDFPATDLTDKSLGL